MKFSTVFKLCWHHANIVLFSSLIWFLQTSVAFRKLFKQLLIRYQLHSFPSNDMPAFSNQQSYIKLTKQLS